MCRSYFVKGLSASHPVNTCRHNEDYETSVWTPQRRKEYPREINARFKCNTCGLQVTCVDNNDPEINALFVQASGGN